MSEEIGGEPFVAEPNVAYCRRVDDGSQLYRDWVEVFGEMTPVPLVYPRPLPGSAPGKPDALFYLLDFQRLAKPTQNAVVDMIARRRNGTHEEIREQIRHDGGVPVLAENLIVIS